MIHFLVYAGDVDVDSRTGLFERNEETSTGSMAGYGGPWCNFINYWPEVMDKSAYIGCATYECEKWVYIELDDSNNVHYDIYKATSVMESRGPIGDPITIIKSTKPDEYPENRI